MKIWHCGGAFDEKRTVSAVNEIGTGNRNILSALIYFFLWDFVGFAFP